MSEADENTVEEVKAKNLEELELPAVQGEVLPVNDEPEEYAAFMHTYLFGPQDRAVHAPVGDGGKREGRVYAVAGMYCMFNDGQDGDTTMYFMLPLDNLEGGKDGKWVRQDALMQGQEDWTVLPRT